MFRAIATLIAVSLALSSIFPAAVRADVVTLLGFAEKYVGPDGGTRTHHGIDIAMNPGEIVEAPMAGSISFAGPVPGPHGGTVLAVTIKDGDRRITMMPLESISVKAGEQLDRGDSVGAIASSGDASSPQPHVHVGLRRGDVYVDPASLFAESAAGAGEPETAVEPAIDEVADDVSVPAVAEAAPTPVQSGVPAPAPAAGVVMSAPGEIEIAGGTEPVCASGGELASGVTLAPDGATEGAMVGGTRRVAQPYDRGQSAPTAQWLVSALRAVGDSPLAIASCFTALAACLVLFARRALVRRLVSEEPMSHRWGSMLRALRAGDTICGLTSCSGHSAFTDPGPL